MGAILTIIFGWGKEHILANLLGAVTGVLALLPGTLLISALSCDEASHWNEFALSLPASKKEVVLSKYILVIAMSILDALLIFGLYMLAIAFGRIEFEMTYVYMSGVVIFSAMLFSGVFFPVSYKVGPEKSRNFFAMFFIIPFILVLFKDFLSRFTINMETVIFWAKLSPIYVRVFFIASFFLSYRFFVKKPF